jgi:hypothetical protein
MAPYGSNAELMNSCLGVNDCTASRGDHKFVVPAWIPVSLELSEASD